MTMPSDASKVVESEGTNDGPRENDKSDIDNGAYVDEQNVPHPVLPSDDDKTGS